MHTLMAPDSMQAANDPPELRSRPEAAAMTHKRCVDEYADIFAEQRRARARLQQNELAWQEERRAARVVQRRLNDLKDAFAAVAAETTVDTIDEVTQVRIAAYIRVICRWRRARSPGQEQGSTQSPATLARSTRLQTLKSSHFLGRPERRSLPITWNSQILPSQARNRGKMYHAELARSIRASQCALARPARDEMPGVHVQAGLTSGAPAAPAASRHFAAGQASGQDLSQPPLASAACDRSATPALGQAGSDAAAFGVCVAGACPDFDPEGSSAFKIS